MFLHQGIYLPDGETHLNRWMSDNGEMVDGRGTYQIKKLRRALSRCKSFRTAVDVGGHVGLWSMQLAKQFAAVHAFEPIAAHRECFMRNLETCENVELVGCALGARPGFVRLDTNPHSSGDTRINAANGDGVVTTPQVGGAPMIPVKTLDSFDLREVDFIKLDCEGYELFALQGAEQIIRRDRPVIIVEQKPGRGQRFGLPERGAVEWLEKMGYAVTDEMSGDFVLVP